jgi:hypothetical protein
MYARQLFPAMDISAGAGVGVGTKLGVGMRLYLLPRKRLTPYIGLNYVRNGKISERELMLDGEKAVYSVGASQLSHLGAGLRWQPGRIGLLATTGYGGYILSRRPISYSYPLYTYPSTRLST